MDHMESKNKLAGLVREGSLGNGMVARGMTALQIGNEYKKYVIDEASEGREPVDKAEFARTRGYM